jgi:hypothetical protein
LPITERGSTSSTLNSRAARAASASTEISTPGASAPPRNSPLADTTSKLVLVPKSTTTAGPAVERVRGQRVDDPVRAHLARVVVRSGTPVFTPGPTTTVGTSAK